MKGPYVPNQKLVMFWEFTILILTIFEIFYLSIRASFIGDPLEIFIILNIVAIVCFFLDILMHFNLGYYQHGQVVTRRRKIAREYLKFWFWFDLITAFPYEYMGQYDQDTVYDKGLLEHDWNKLLGAGRFYALVRLLRIAKVEKLFNDVERYLDLGNNLRNLMYIWKVILTVLVIAHIVACFWHFEGLWGTTFSEKTWIVNYKLDNEKNWVYRYISSLYFTIATMQTVGFGDIIPVATLEKDFAIVIMMMATVVFGYTMNKMNLLVQGLDNTTDLYK